MVVSIGSCSIVVGIWAENGTESLLLSLREVALGVLWLTRREVVGRLTGRVGVLIVVSLALRRESETTGFVDVEEMALKFGKWWQSFVI